MGQGAVHIAKAEQGLCPPSPACASTTSGDDLVTEACILGLSALLSAQASNSPEPQPKHTLGIHVSKSKSCVSVCVGWEICCVPCIRAGETTMPSKQLAQVSVSSDMLP